MRVRQKQHKLSHTPRFSISSRAARAAFSLTRSYSSNPLREQLLSQLDLDCEAIREKDMSPSRSNEDSGPDDSVLNT